MTANRPWRKHSLFLKSKGRFMNRRWTALLIVLCSIFSFSTALAQNYAPAVNYSTQVQPVGLTRGDFNEDGKPDVMVTNAGSGTLSLFLGNGDGTFGNAISIVVGANPISVVSADFNGDGHQDIAVSLGNSQSFQVLFGNGNGIFQAPVTVAIPNIATSTVGQLVAQDVNGDHKADLAIATDRGVAIFINNGAGGFSAAAMVDSGAIIANLVVVDITGDGQADVVGTELTTDASGNTDGNVFFARGNGNGTFQTPMPVTQFIGTPAGITVGDLNNDGLVDIVVSNSGGVVGGSGGSGLGGPFCTPRICMPVDGPPPLPPVTVPGEISVLLQQSNGTFSLSSHLSGDRNPGDVSLVDLNGDGNLDIVDAASSSTTPALMTFSNQGNGTFSAPNVLGLPFSAAEVLSAPLTSTVALDLVATLPAGNEISVFVNQGANTLSLTSSTNPSIIAQPVTLSATVHPLFPSAISGSVVFADGPNTLGSSPVSPAGVSTLTATFVASGTHPLVAVYSGSSTLVGGSSASLSQKVNAATATVSLTGSGTPTVFGQVVSLTTIVTASGGGAVPTGSINLFDGSSIILSGTLDGGGKFVASTSSLSLGSHTLTAQYSGDANYAAATSSPLVQTVNKSNAAVILASTTNPSVFGQALLFSASVSASGGTGIPTGTVTLNDSGVSVGSTPLNSAGIAGFGGIVLNAGSHSLIAVYSGDQNFSSGASSLITQIVSKADSTISLSSLPNPSTFGQPVQLNAIVAGTAGGAPSGSVMFSDGAIQLGSAVLNNGRAALSISSLGTGLHNITASYAGDGNFNPSIASGASSVIQTVAKSNTAATISTSPNPSAPGQAVTVTATIAALGGNASPTGSVAFTDGTVSLGTRTVVGGAASLNVSTLATGSHSLVATYSGDANFLASQSSVDTQVVAVPVVSKNFTLNLQDSETTISAGQTFTTRITLTPVGGLTGPVTSICLGVPLDATCSITPASAIFDGKDSIAAQVVITTTGGEARSSSGGSHGSNDGRQPERRPETGRAALQFGIFPAALLGLTLLPRAKRKVGGLAVCAMLAFSLTGCGSDAGARGKLPTPSGSYTITVQSQSGSLTHLRTIQLKVR
jgi:hypothetical protein